MKMLNRILLPLVVAFLSLMGATAAMAQGSKTWMPAFDAEQHVYIDQKLEKHRDYPVSMPNLRSNIEEAQKKHGLKVYVIATEQGSESSPSNTLAAQKLDELILKWRQDPAFPTDDYLVILWVRFKDDPLHGSVAANGGNRLRGYGYTADYFSSSDGPVIPVLKRYMRNNPELALSTIVDNVNDGVTNAIQAEKDAEAQREFMKQLPSLLLKWALILGVVGTFLTFLIRYFRNRGRAKRELRQFVEGLNRSTALSTALREKHQSFLQSTADWKSRFTGESLTKLEAGLEAYSELLSICKAGSARKVEAEKKFRSRWFPRVLGFREALVELTEREVVITSKDIDLEFATLFQGLKVEKKSAPDQMFDDSQSLHDTAEAALSGLKAALARNDEAEGKARTTIAWTEDANRKLIGEGLNMAPYQASIDALNEAIGVFKKAAFNDPVTLNSQAPALEEQAAAVQSNIERTLTLAATIKEVGATIDGVEQQAATLRRTNVDYKFTAGEQRQMGDTYRLNEEAGNPDPSVRAGRQSLKDALAQLLRGRQDKTDELIAAARQKRDEAEETIKSVFAAKEKVEANNGLVKDSKAVLTTGLEAARSAFRALTADFLVVNFPDAEREIADSASLLAACESRFAELKRTYGSQKYLAAAAQLDQLLANLDEQKIDCQAVVDRLALLKRLREESRTIVGESQPHADRLKPLLSERAFTTAKATDDSYAAAVVELADLTKEVAKPVTDWIKSHERATALAAGLKQIESDCNEQFAFYNEGVELIGTLQADVENAATAIGELTLATARDALKTAGSANDVLVRAIKVAKSDWKAIRDSAVSAHALCDTVRNEAAKDERNHKNAHLMMAYSKVRSRRYAKRKHKFLIEGNKLLVLAQKAFAKRDWQSASDTAYAAFKLFVRFERMNRRRLATMVVKGAPGHASSAPPVASGSTYSSDDTFAQNVAIAIGVHIATQSGSSSSSSSSSSSGYSSPSYSPSPSYGSSSGGGSISISTGGGSIGGGSGGGGY